MKIIGLLSDTHCYVGEFIYDFFKNCDEIWHAGDVGNIETLNKLAEFKPLKGVFGNVDDNKVRTVFKKSLRFNCENTDVLISHITGYPGNYNKEIKNILSTNPPKLLIGGHSHILKVIYDKNYSLLHINPGAAGNYGFHNVITLIRFVIDKSEIKDLDIFEKQRK